ENRERREPQRPPGRDTDDGEGEDDRNQPEQEEQRERERQPTEAGILGRARQPSLGGADLRAHEVADEVGKIAQECQQPVVCAVPRSAGHRDQLPLRVDFFAAPLTSSTASSTASETSSAAR